MKKTKLLLLTLLMLCLSACGIKHGDPWDKMETKLESKSYKISGEMKLITDEDTYKYDLDIESKNSNYYKVSLTNNINGHKQVILKNNTGVYVVTPALNKSFKFQSQWPENSSQSYLPESILKDIKSTKEIKINKKGKYKIVNAKVSYPNNSKLVSEDIYFDKNGNLKKVIVLDKEGKAVIKMEFYKIKYGVNYSKNHFKLSSIVNENVINNPEESKESTACEGQNCPEKEEKTSAIEDVIYPLYVPKNTSLASKEEVNGDNGPRFIMTYQGTKPFMIIEEASLKNKDMQVVNVYGDPAILTASIGALSDNSLEWHTGNMQYYISSSKLTGEEMLTIAESLTSASVISEKNNK